MFSQNLIEAFRRVMGTTRTSTFLFFCVFTILFRAIHSKSCSFFFFSFWVFFVGVVRMVVFDLGSVCFVWWYCFFVVFFLEEVVHGCVLVSDNFE